MENVKVNITTTHKTDEGNLQIKIECDGIYLKRDDYHYIKYEYIDEENGGCVKTMIKASDDLIEVHSKGDSNYHMIFEKNSVHPSVIQMQKMSIDAYVATKDLQIDVKKDKIGLSIDYELHVNGEVMTEAIMKIDMIKGK